MAEHKWDPSYFYDQFMWEAIPIVCSELVVDWIKHMFITKFNNIDTTIYRRFTAIL